MSCDNLCFIIANFERTTISYFIRLYSSILILCCILFDEFLKIIIKITAKHLISLRRVE